MYGGPNSRGRGLSPTKGSGRQMGGGFTNGAGGENTTSPGRGGRGRAEEITPMILEDPP